MEEVLELVVWIKLLLSKSLLISLIVMYSVYKKQKKEKNSWLQDISMQLIKLIKSCK